MDSLRSWNSNLDYVALDVVPRWPYIFYFVVVCLIAKTVASHLWRSFQERKKGYGAIPRYPQLDPFLGLDVAFSMVASVRKHTMLLWLRNLHVKGKAKTISYNFFGTRFIHTTEPENMKALFATPVWKDFGVAPLRRNNSATMPFADKGVGTVDGHEWEISKSLIKPYFAREVVNNTQRLEKHTDDLLSLIPKDGATFDIQELLQRWVFLPQYFLAYISGFSFSFSDRATPVPRHVHPLYVWRVYQLPCASRARRGCLGHDGYPTRIALPPDDG